MQRNIPRLPAQWDPEIIVQSLTPDQVKSIDFLRAWIDAKLASNEPVFEVDAVSSTGEIVVTNKLIMYCLYMLGLKPLGGDEQEEEMQFDFTQVETIKPSTIRRYAGADISRLLLALGYSGDLITFSGHGYAPQDQLADVLPPPLRKEP